MSFQNKYPIGKPILAIAIGVCIIFVSCKNEKKQGAESRIPDFHLRQAMIEECIMKDNLTILRCLENGRNIWISVPQQKVSNGDLIFFTNEGIKPQINYLIKESNSVIDTLWSVDKITVNHRQGKTLVEKIDKEEINSKSNLSMPPGHSGGRVAPVKKEVKVKPISGTISIARLYEDKKQYANKKIKISGVVVKINPNIMGRNWIHLQDGTSYQNSFDLTVTTDELVKVGETITFEGIIALDKDFTSGYFYDVIMEKASRVGE